MKVLGGGGFGKTYEASDLGKQTKVIKVLINNSPKAVELFQREADVLSQLNNPGIPKVEPNSYIVFRPANSQEPVHCLVMEKIEGMNLRDYVKRLGHPIDFDTAERWLQELVTILQAVHNRGILHRDIKPQNIIFKPDGRLALIDFGAVREGTGTEFASTTGSGSGTEVASHMAGGTSVVSRGYTPPEQMNGEALKQSDFYSLGRTFVFLLTGKEPSEIPYDAHDDVLQWRKYASNVEPKLAQLLDRMQSVSVRQRPKNTEEILQILGSSSTSQQPNDRTHSQSPIRGEDVEVQLEISVKEATKGASKTVSFTRSVNINGKQQQETKQITVAIPQGAREGQKLRLKEQGHAGKYGGDAGDAYVQITIEELSTSRGILKYAGIIPRFISFVVDTFCAVQISFWSAYWGMHLVGLSSSTSLSAYVFICTVIYTFFIAYHALFESWYGSTLGKLIFGIAVTNLYGNKVSFFTSVLRLHIKVFSVCLFGLGIITTGIGYFKSPRKQGIHDYLTKTVVVRRSSAKLS